MDRDELNVGDRESVSGEQRVKRLQREVAEVLVVDRVELDLVDELPDVRNLDHGDAVRLQEPGDALDEPVEIGNVRENVVCVDDVCTSPLVDETRGQLATEELDDRRDPTLAFGNCGDVRRRLDTQHGDAGLLVVLEKVAVVAGDLDGQALRPKRSALHQATGDLSCRREHGVREGREVQVLAEQLCW